MIKLSTLPPALSVLDNDTPVWADRDLIIHEQPLPVPAGRRSPYQGNLSPCGVKVHKVTLVAAVAHGDGVCGREQCWGKVTKRRSAGV